MTETSDSSNSPKWDEFGAGDSNIPFNSEQEDILVEPKLPVESPADKVSPRVEGSTEVAPVKFNTFGIRGFDEIPMSILPTSWISIVQPSSSKTILADGREAIPGFFYIKQDAQQIEKLNMVFLRVKRRISIQPMTGEERVSLVALGLHITDGYAPFLISFSITSFKTMGIMMDQMRKLGVKDSWEYSVLVTTEKIVKDRQGESVKYYEARFEIGDKFSQEERDQFYQVYLNLGGAIDRVDDISGGN